MKNPDDLRIGKIGGGGGGGFRRGREEDKRRPGREEGRRRSKEKTDYSFQDDKTSPLITIQLASLSPSPSFIPFFYHFFQPSFPSLPLLDFLHSLPSIPRQSYNRTSLHHLIRPYLT